MSIHDELPHVDPSDWPQEGTTLTDEEALTMALLLLNGKPRSYVEGAKRLAQYVVDLNLQVEERSEAIADLVKRDTIPVIPEGVFTDQNGNEYNYEPFEK